MSFSNWKTNLFDHCIYFKASPEKLNLVVKIFNENNSLPNICLRSNKSDCIFSFNKIKSIK